MYVCIRIGPRVPPPRDTYYGTSTSTRLTRLSGLGSCRPAYSGSLDDVCGGRVLGVITCGGGMWSAGHSAGTARTGRAVTSAAGGAECRLGDPQRSERLCIDVYYLENKGREEEC